MRQEIIAACRGSWHDDEIANEHGRRNEDAEQIQPERQALTTILLRAWQREQPP